MDELKSKKNILYLINKIILFLNICDNKETRQFIKNDICFFIKKYKFNKHFTTKKKFNIDCLKYLYTKYLNDDDEKEEENSTDLFCKQNDFNINEYLGNSINNFSVENVITKKISNNYNKCVMEDNNGQNYIPNYTKENYIPDYGENIVNIPNLSNNNNMIKNNSQAYIPNYTQQNHIFNNNNITHQQYNEHDIYNQNNDNNYTEQFIDKETLENEIENEMLKYKNGGVNYKINNIENTNIIRNKNDTNLFDPMGRNNITMNNKYSPNKRVEIRMSSNTATIFNLNKTINNIELDNIIFEKIYNINNNNNTLIIHIGNNIKNITLNNGKFSLKNIIDLINNKMSKIICYMVDNTIQFYSDDIVEIKKNNFILFDHIKNILNNNTNRVTIELKNIENNISIYLKNISDKIFANIIGYVIMANKTFLEYLPVDVKDLNIYIDNFQKDTILHLIFSIN